MTDKEKGDFYNQFLKLISEDIKKEVSMENDKFWTTNKAIDARVKMIKKDIKEYIERHYER